MYEVISLYLQDHLKVFHEPFRGSSEGVYGQAA